MQVSLENTGSLERKLTVRMPSARLDERVRSRLRELSQTVRIKGFRPGKVPAQVIEQRFGPQVRSEALGEVIGDSFREAVQQEKLRIAAQPAINTQQRGEKGEIEYTATFEVVPELGAIDVSNLEVSRPVSTVEDADIERMIETLRAQRRQWPAVERASQPTDLVVFEYSAQAGDVRFPAAGLERAGTIIGSGALFTAFESALIGAAAGDHKSLELDFPADFREPTLAGKSAKVELTVVRVQESRLPELDEAFAAEFGVREGGLERFRSDVRANLERELKGAIRVRLKSEVLEKLVAAHAGFEIPRAMIDSEAAALLAEARRQAEQAKLTPPTDASAYHAVASHRIRAFLLLSEISRQQQIGVDNDRVRAELATLASTYEDPQQVVALYARDQDLMANLKNRVLEDQVVEWIADHAKSTEMRLAFDQLIQSVRS